MASLYHKVHSARWGNVWCTHCDWREQPPLLIPLVLLHDISGKDIPLLVKPSLVLPPFSVHPPLLTLSFPQFLSITSLLSYFLVLSLSFIPSSSPLPSILPYKHGRIWVVGRGRGGEMRLSPWRSTSKQSSKRRVGV